MQVRPGQPLDMMRQVQIAAGSLILLGAALGFAVSPWFYALCALMGAGLLFAGLTLIILSLSGVIGIWGWIGLVFVATALINFCPIYRVLGISTKKK